MQPPALYIEEQQLDLPTTENGVCNLGDLFNCRTGMGVRFNLFGKNLLKKHVCPSPISDTSYTLSHIKNSTDKVKSLEVSGNMSLEIMAGLIKVEGSAAYDTSDTNSSQTETLSCDYRFDGFQVDLLPNARAVIDPHVEKMIIDNQICATHIVNGVVIGGKLNAKISISKKDAKQQQDIKGSCFGKLVYGPINASIQAKLKMLDSDESSCFDKQITIRSKPNITDQQPITIEDMFRVIGNFSSAINKQTHYTDWDANIRGVPLKFVLVPIVQFLNYGVEKLYAQLEDRIFQRFKDLLINVQDYLHPKYVEKQIIDRSEDVSFLLMNDQSALSLMVSEYGKDLRCKANNVYQKAVSLLSDHRCGNVKPEKMLEMLIDSEKSINPFEVVQKIKSFIETAQTELTGMRHKDISHSNSIKVFTDKTNLTEWFSSELGCKISLQTNGRQQGVFHKFNVLSQELSKFGFEVAVSSPSASQNFSLSIKLFDDAKEYTSDISYVLAILKCAVVSYGAGAEYDFFNLYSNIFGISLPLEPNEINNINSLIGNLDGYQNIYKATSRLEILARLANSSAELTFFIPIEAFETSFDAVSNLTGFHTRYSNVDWIVGPFLKNHLVAPMLLIFKGRSLIGSCFDNVDLLLLDLIWSKTSEGTNYDFSILSTKNYQHTFHGDRLEYVKELLITLNDTNTLGQLSEAKFWNTLKLIVNDNAQNVVLLLQATAVNDQILFNQRLASVVLKKVPTLLIHNVEEIISRNEDIPQLIVTLEAWLKQQSPITALIYKILDLIKDFKSAEDSADIESELRSAVVSLIEHADCEQAIRDIYNNWQNSSPSFLFSKVEDAIQNHIRNQTSDDMWYVRELIKSLTDCNATVQQDIMMAMCQRIGLTDVELKRIQDLIRNRIYRTAAAAISRHKYGSKMNIFENHICKMNDAKNHQLLLDSVIESGFIRSPELWRNAKFLYLVQENLKSQSFLRNIVRFYNYLVPEYIPPHVKTVLDKISMEYKDFEFPLIIQTLQDFENFLISIIRLKGKKSVPTEFRNFLTSVIAGNDRLKMELHQSDALPHWNFSEDRFNKLWDFNDIQLVLTKLSNEEDESRTDAVNPVKGFISLDVDLNVQDEMMPIKNNGVINVRDQFKVIFGDTLNTISNAEFVKLTKFVSKPSFNNINIRGYGSTLLPYLLQQIKMVGCDNLLAENMYQLVESTMSGESEQSTVDSDDIFNHFDAGNDQECFESSNNSISISRLDCLTGLFNITDVTVAQDIVRNISQFSMSLPLVIQNIDKNDEAPFKFLLPFLIGLKIKWEQQHGSIAENFLFQSPFQLILAVRIGTPTQIGKSSILNQVLVCRKTKNMFASKSSPGNEFGPALTLPGSVEFIWLTEETVDKTLWETLRPHYCDGKDRPLILLANLHGNVFDYSDTVKLLAQFTTAHIIFVMTTSKSTGATMKADCDSFKKLVGNNVKNTIVIVDPFNNSNNDNIIRTSQLTNERTLMKIRKLIESSVTSTTGITYGATAILQSPTFAEVESIERPESSKVIDIVKRKGPLEIRRALQLQRGFNSVEKGKSKWERCELLQEIIHSFCNILRLPKNQRMKALLHMESEICAMSNDQSKTLRNDILKQKNELRKIVFIQEQSKQVEKLRKSIKSIQNTLNDITLGLEHFYRELAQIYFINLSLKASIQADSFIFMAPEKYAELFIDGHAIEILDGDACNLHQLWLMEIFRQVSIKKPNLRIFVVTILGLQSSGKSTLLNALFACRFAVSVGRCTRGLFARLLFLDDGIKNEFNIVADAILLIDTEGLGAPEMMNDPDSTKKDRKLATFAMGISGLTIINMLGEYMTDLTDILQIAIIAMARLEITGMSPDIMVVQHHLTERNTDMVTTAIDSFNTALNNAITLTEQTSNIKMGIRGAKCLQKMIRRLQSGEMLKSFSPYKDGATANSPPSKQYQNDVVSLYISILRVCQESGQIFDFQKWYGLLRDFWSSVATEDFAVNFKNLKEVQEFITLGKLIATFKEAVDLVFRHHGDNIESYLNVTISSDQSPSTNRKKNLIDVKRFIYMMPDICMDETLRKNSSLCVKCRRVVNDQNKLLDFAESKQKKTEIYNTIFEYKRDMKSSKLTYLTQRYDAMVIGNQSCDEFERRVDEVLKLKLESRSTTYSEEEITKIEQEIWISLIGIASRRQITDMVENTIKDEVLRIYERLNIGIVKAYDDYRQTPWYTEKAIIGMLKDKKLDDSQERWFREEAKILPSTIVENFPIYSFDMAMVRALVRRTSETIETKILNAFEDTHKVKLVGKFTTQYTAYALKQFKSHMIGLEKTWKKANDPMEVLQMKKDYYVTMIGTRLRHGFNYYGDGRIASELVLSAINDKSIKFANDARVDNLLGVNWFTCCESIRLNYFKKLIVDIKNGNTVTGAEHFLDPQYQFKRWFKSEVDTYANDVVALSAFLETFRREHNLFVQSIQNNDGKADVVFKKITQILKATGKEYKTSSTFESGLSNNLPSFISGLLDGLKNVTQIELFNSGILPPLSDDATILKRVGCMKSCKYCGAMCMGSYGHEKDTGDTKLHHTLHQPEGLAGTKFRTTNVLVDRSCNNEVDTNIWYTGSVKTTWAAIKESDWLYAQSCKVEFRDLMIWFFKELQNDIASRRGAVPITSHEIEKLGWNNIASIDVLVTEIESTISGA